MFNRSFLTILVALFLTLFSTTQALAEDDISVTIEDADEAALPSHWHSAFEISVQGGVATEQFVFILPTSAGVDWSVSAGWHGEKYGFTLQFENGQMWFWDELEDDDYRCDSYENDCNEFDDGSFLSPFLSGYHGAVSGMFDFYFPHDSFVFRLGLGLSIFFDMNCSDEYVFPMFRGELSWSWILTDHIRLGIEVEMSSLIVINYIRPSAVLTFSF